MVEMFGLVFYVCVCVYVYQLCASCSERGPCTNSLMCELYLRNTGI